MTRHETFQSSGATHGWGNKSVNTMVKHWYGYGAQEAGRDSHFGHGEFAVYPGNNLAMHKLPFSQGAFRLKGGQRWHLPSCLPTAYSSAQRVKKYGQRIIITVEP